MKWFHNRGIVKWVLAAVGIVIALYFAWSFYPFGEWSGKQFLSGVWFGPQILGVICACIMFGLVLLMLFYKEYMREDVKAFGAAKRDTSYETALTFFVWFVMGMELFSIVFRITILGTGKYNAVLFGVGLVGMGLTYVIGKVLHAQVNRPASVEASRIMNDAGNTVLGRAGKDMDKLSNDDLRHVHAGNFNPLNRIQSASAARKQRKLDEEEQKHMDWLAEKQHGEEAANNFLDPTYSDPASSNGHVHVRGDGRGIITSTKPF